MRDVEEELTQLKEEAVEADKQRGNRNHVSRRSWRRENRRRDKKGE